MIFSHVLYQLSYLAPTKKPTPVLSDSGGFLARCRLRRYRPALPAPSARQSHGFVEVPQETSAQASLRRRVLVWRSLVNSSGPVDADPGRDRAFLQPEAPPFGDASTNSGGGI